MTCWHCGSKLYWQNDFSYEDYGYPNDIEEGIVTIPQCSNEECGVYYEVYLGLAKNVE